MADKSGMAGKSGMRGRSWITGKSWMRGWMAGWRQELDSGQELEYLSNFIDHPNPQLIQCQDATSLIWARTPLSIDESFYVT